VTGGAGTVGSTGAGAAGSAGAVGAAATARVRALVDAAAVVFLAVGFFGAGAFAVGFLAVVFLAVGFFGAGAFAVGFFAVGFFAVVFLAAGLAADFAVVFLAAGFAADLAVVFFAVGLAAAAVDFLAAGFAADFAVVFLAAGFGVDCLAVEGLAVDLRPREPVLKANCSATGSSADFDLDRSGSLSMRAPHGPLYGTDMPGDSTRSGRVLSRISSTWSRPHDTGSRAVPCGNISAP
jgi:hypothetical protein